ncbi:serine protease [Streptomyces sp. Tue 6430]|nr:serine protease [Streptomyces sp. Tue 6430]
MAGQSPRTGGGRDTPRHGPRAAHEDDPRPFPGPSLIRVQDLAGRPRGTGFLADHHGTVVTSHEAVDGLTRLVLYGDGDGDRGRVVTADEVTPLPELDLALVRTQGLDVDPLPVTVREGVGSGTYVRLAAGCWREARVLGAACVTYAATDRFHRLAECLELAIGTAGRDALRLGGGAAGGPVLDAGTGAVVAVLGTALRSDHHDTGFAVPLRPGPPGGPLADLLARNAATVPAYGADLNLAGVLELAATSIGSGGPPAHPHTTVERALPAGEFAAFAESRAAVLALVGAPGSGRTTALAALAGRRARGPEPAPTLWLRGADLRDADRSVADAARRALTRAARIVAASRPVPALDDLTPERLARLARAAGRPMLLVLDGPEEMPPLLAHRLPEWTGGTVDWLRETGARLVTACLPEHWEQAGPHFPAGVLHGRADRSLPPHVPLGDLTEDEAGEARARLGVPDTALAGPDARHPLTLRLYAEVRAALPDTVPAGPVGRDEVFAAHLDLLCLRIAVRLAAENGVRGTAVRLLAAKVSGQVHEAARRCLGPGQGELDRTSFEAVFPWGPAPARLGGGTGWASAVLAEGLLVPAGGGYRFAHEELADWLQGLHLDLDEALHALVHRPRTAAGSHPLPVPHHRIGPVVQALLHLGRQQGAEQLGPRLLELTHALEADPGSWWAARLLAETLSRVPDATPYTGVLRLLADLVVTRGDRPEPADRPDRGDRPDRFGPDFWAALPLPDGLRLDLLRRLVLADPAPDAEDVPRHLDAVARLLADDTTAVQPLLALWFDDERPLPATPHATVATAAQALLHTHRHRGLDDLTEVLADRAHPRADELLAVLAEDEPSALCRAVDRWAHDERPRRRAAAMAYGPRAAAHARTRPDRELLRHAALAVLARPADRDLHGAALALLVRDPEARDRHLPRALERFAREDPDLLPSALLTALATHPGPVLDACRARLAGPGTDTGPLLRALVDATTPALARRVAPLLREVLERRPEAVGDLAACLDERLDLGHPAPDVLFPLVTGLLDGGSEAVRAALAGVLTGPGALRGELLDFLLAREHDVAVLDAVLHAAGRLGGPDLRVLVHRTGLLLGRTPEGAARFDRGLVDLARHLPGFAAQLAAVLAGRPAGQPAEWAALVGPDARRAIEHLAGARVPV